MADLYHDGQIGYWTAYEAIKHLLRQPGSGVDPGARESYTRTLLGLDPGDSGQPVEAEEEEAADEVAEEAAAEAAEEAAEEEAAEKPGAPPPRRKTSFAGLVWMQNPGSEWRDNPSNLYRIQVRPEQVDGLVADGWSREDEDITASEWARITGTAVGSTEYIAMWGDDAEEDDIIGIGEDDPIGAFSRRTRFLSSIGQGGRGPKDPYEMYQAGLFNPLNRLFELKDLFGIALGDTVPEEETFFGRGAEFARDPKSIYEQSRDLLAQLLNLGKERRRISGVTFTPEWDGDFGQTAADISNQQMADLFHMALRSKTSRGTADRFASRLKRRPGDEGELGIEQSLHEEATAAGLTEQPFLEWIRDKYNLGSLLGV
tara:strand:- start:5047 stop:6162 length:1116 start_codon:yes stop_codon:yes gene_type:complete